MIRRRAFSRTLACFFAFIALPSATAAQFVTLGSGSTPTLPTGTMNGAAVAYDPVHDAYLYVSRSRSSVFTDANGNPDGPVFDIPIVGGTGVSAVYSPDVSDGAGGIGGFLVIGTDRVGNDLVADAQIVAYPGRLVGSPVRIYYFFTPGACGCSFQRPSAAYSPTDHTFLAVLGPVRFLIAGWNFVRLDLNAQPIGAPVYFGSTPMAYSANAVWNAAANEFGILYGGSPLRFTRVRPDGVVMRETIVGSGVVTHALAANPTRGTYLIATLGNNNVETAEISAAGDLLSATTIGPPPGASFMIGLAFSSVTGGYALDVAGLVVELNAVGAPTGVSFDTGSWPEPAIAASSKSAKWLVTFPSGFLGLGLGPRTVERSDFSGDGKSDVIWQHPDTGAVLLWTMNGPSYSGGTIINPGGTLWQVVGSSDFSGDGKPDLLWQHPDTGALLLWRMDGPNYVAGTMLSPGGTDWRVVATGPFTGHGGPDIVWQHQYSGELLLWTMYGSAHFSSTMLNSGTLWQVVGAADFTGDGQTDLLWQDPVSGALLLWVMNGPNYVGSIMLSAGGTYWRVVAVADYTGDGQPDIVWQLPSTGAVLLWTMSGPTYVGSTLLNAGGTYWQVKAPR